MFQKISIRILNLANSYMKNIIFTIAPNSKDWFSIENLFQ